MPHIGVKATVGAAAGAGKKGCCESMKNVWLWIIGIGTILIVCLAFLLGLGLLRIQGMPMNWVTGGSYVWRDGNWHHHGLRWGVPMMGLFGGVLMLIFPLGLLVVTVVGIILLVRALQQPSQNRPDDGVRACENCGKKIAPDWQVCPYCGQSLGGK